MPVFEAVGGRAPVVVPAALARGAGQWAMTGGGLAGASCPEGQYRDFG